jgi:hypothetical protein
VDIASEGQAADRTGSGVCPRRRSTAGVTHMKD